MECDGKQQRQQPDGDGVDQVHCSGDFDVTDLIRGDYSELYQAQLTSDRQLSPFLQDHSIPSLFRSKCSLRPLAAIATNPRDVRFASNYEQ
jgi:hypothetical protein